MKAILPYQIRLKANSNSKIILYLTFFISVIKLAKSPCWSADDMLDCWALDNVVDITVVPGTQTLPNTPFDVYPTTSFATAAAEIVPAALIVLA